MKVINVCEILNPAPAGVLQLFALLEKILRKNIVTVEFTFDMTYAREKCYLAKNNANWAVVYEVKNLSLMSVWRKNWNFFKFQLKASYWFWFDFKKFAYNTNIFQIPNQLTVFHVHKVCKKGWRMLPFKTMLDVERVHQLTYCFARNNITIVSEVLHVYMQAIDGNKKFE